MFFFIFILKNRIYNHDGIRIFLELFFCIASGYFALKIGKERREKTIDHLKNRENILLAEKEEAFNQYTILKEDFNEDFLPAHVRSDEALDFIIKALETERAYTIKQAIYQWEDYIQNKERVQYVQNDPLFDEDTSVVKCPNCGSTQIQIVEKGYSLGKAAIGAVLLGSVGLVAGAFGSKKVERICVNCKTKF